MLASVHPPRPGDCCAVTVCNTTHTCALQRCGTNGCSYTTTRTALAQAIGNNCYTFPLVGSIHVFRVQLKEDK